MKNVKFEKLNETVKGEKYYLLFKVSTESKSGYCIAVEDDGLYVEGMGNDVSRAKEMYNMISCAEVSAIHISEVVRDLQNEIFM